jgi:hypothetical protein
MEGGDLDLDKLDARRKSHLVPFDKKEGINK